MFLNFVFGPFTLNLSIAAINCGNIIVFHAAHENQPLFP